MENEIIFIDEKQNEFKGTLLSKIKYDNNEYILYTDNYRNEDNELRILASKIKVINKKVHIYKIETEEEWKYIENVMNLLLNSKGE